MALLFSPQHNANSNTGIAKDLSIDFATPRTALRRLGRRTNAPLPADRALFEDPQAGGGYLNGFDAASPKIQRRLKVSPGGGATGTLRPPGTVTTLGDAMFLSAGYHSPNPNQQTPLKMSMATPIPNGPHSLHTSKKGSVREGYTNSTVRTNVSSVALNISAYNQSGSGTPAMRITLSQTPLTCGGASSPTATGSRSNGRYTSLGVGHLRHLLDEADANCLTPVAAPKHLATHLAMSIERDQANDSDSDDGEEAEVGLHAPARPSDPDLTHCIPTALLRLPKPIHQNICSPEGVVHSPPAPRLQPAGRFHARPPGPTMPRPPSADQACLGSGGPPTGTFVRTFVPRPPPPRG